MSFENLQSYFLQVALLVAVGGAVPFLLRMRLPQLRLVYWQMLFLTCFLLPFVQPWQQRASVTFVAKNQNQTAGVPIEEFSYTGYDWAELTIWCLVAGAVLKLLWICIGLWRLRMYANRAVPFRPQPDLMGTDAIISLSREVSRPVTFGSAILLPADFPELSHATQRAILCHELLHVQRRDWLFTLLEESASALLWFHPAVWWLLGRIRLTREQAVDREAIRLTEGTDDYVQALLTVSGAKAQLDLVPAPLFLRRRHLFQRLNALLKETTMSKQHRIASSLLGFVFAVAAVFVAARSFPLLAAPQLNAPSSEVKAHAGNMQLLHQTPLIYPAEAKAARVQGMVSLELTIDERGLVSDAKVLSGPEMLRKAALRTVLDWHFTKPATPTNAQVTLEYRLGPAEAFQAVVPKEQAPGQLLNSVKVDVPEPLRSSLEQQLAPYQGRTLSQDMHREINEIVRNAEPHASMRWGRDSLTVSVLNATADSGGPQIRVGGNVQSAKLVHRTPPVYPPLAKQARIQGTVRFDAVIAKDGTVRVLTLVAGHPLLAPTATEAVQQWTYQPTLLNGTPVEVLTMIDVNFTLSE